MVTKSFRVTIRLMPARPLTGFLFFDYYLLLPEALAPSEGLSSGNHK